MSEDIRAHIEQALWARNACVTGLRTALDIIDRTPAVAHEVGLDEGGEPFGQVMLHRTADGSAWASMAITEDGAPREIKMTQSEDDAQAAYAFAKRTLIMDTGILDGHSWVSAIEKAGDGS